MLQNWIRYWFLLIGVADVLSSVHALSVVNILHNALTLYKRVVGSKQQCSPSQRWAGETHTHTHAHTYTSKQARTHAHTHTQQACTLAHAHTHRHTQASTQSHTTLKQASQQARTYARANIRTHTHKTVLHSAKNTCKTDINFLWVTYTPLVQ